MYPHPFDVAPIARQIWDSKYRLKAPDGTPLEADIEATWTRVATAVAAAEKGNKRESAKRSRKRWADRFQSVLSSFEFLPAGRIIAGAGTARRVTLFNCFVMGEIADDLGSIFDNVREAALTMQQGGGIGHDFSTLRPQGAPVRSTGSDASGPVSFMDVWDAMCRTIMSAGARRGAMMGTMRCDHPDIERFIAAKSEAGHLTNFNLSVLVTDAFIAAVREGRTWPLQFGGKIWRTVQARDLWDRIMRSTYDHAEPGVIFIDRINARNNLAYCEAIKATNPCGEQPLPPYGACLLGSINLSRLVRDPFKPTAAIDIPRLEEVTALAVRFLDNCIDVSRYPLPQQKVEARAKRRIGLGITGLADALIFMGLRYGTPEAAAVAGRIMSAIERAAYSVSSALAREKGAFELFEAAPLLGSPNVAKLPADIRAGVERDGLRNGCLTSIAPTGTISLIAGNVSGGIEPVFDLAATRRVRRADGGIDDHHVEDFAYALYRRRSHAAAGEPLPSAFVTAAELTPRQHLDMQAAVQGHVDSSISKTINCPVELSFDDFKSVYLEAYDLGLKGCTTFRPNPVTGSVLTPQPQSHAQPDRSRPSTASTAPAPADVASASVAAAASPPPAPRSIEPPRAVARVVDASEAREAAAPAVVYMTKPLEREAALAGFTYKLAWPGSDHAIYVTINDIERDGRRRPFEIFINTKNLEHYAWTVALTRMISAVFRRGGDITFVVEELKAIFDPQGGHWINGRYVPSLLAAIGEIIEGHMRRIGFLQADEAAALPPMARAGVEAPPAGSVGPGAGPVATAASAAGAVMSGPPVPSASPSARRVPACPRCSRPELVREEGCLVCRNCGYSRCG